MQDDTTTTKSKVKRNTLYSDAEPEVVLEPVPNPIQQPDVVPTVGLESSPPVVVMGSSSLEPSTYVLDTMMQELRQSPGRAIDFVHFLGKITRGWEPIGSNGNPINEVPVPPGKNPRDFVRAATSTVHVSGFRLATIFGTEVASIIKDSPKWRVTILGEYQIDTPFVQHSSRAEQNAKEFAENKLRDLGYIIG